MKKQIFGILLVIFLYSYTNAKSKIENIDFKSNTITKKYFDTIRKPNYIIISSKISSMKALTKKLSEYTRRELVELPKFKTLTITIEVEFDITKKELENTLKFIASKKSEENKDIDEIVIFAYDDKDDIGKIGYTYGKLLWAPNGKKGNITPNIAEYNIRTEYKFNIDIIEKVGNISKSDFPSKRELAIYKMVMDDEHILMDEEMSKILVMKKFKIKTEEEFNRIFLKVAKFKSPY
jgi:hypothetical protein